ncbi:hypothetical protein Q4E93_31065 [Flavitalea sp. BT771]|uniref:hypothetical protein n=1 Tax=Flavitalea sp. BT771 TaxID=3063329 RepID=UPI0026E1C4C7|nr:hypothetical protein [Flavitalea sp. BT771]MDO6435097.1 hypothetical protein [Flavitalea sp. BT771]MDV6223997.1 hypothetical protein [Flavitalea sp. BT771]
MSHYRNAFFICLIFCLPKFSFSQQLDSVMNIYANNFPQEKVYVHFDKKIYNPGETIWFKAYIFSGADPSLFSKNFYTELSDADGTIIERKVSPILEATAAGNYDLPKVLKSRHLHFRAYTTWMTNFDTAFYYEKDIRVYDKKTDSGVTAIPQQAMIQFFPESGDMVAGVESMVAFKANDQFGLPVKVKGMIVDGKGKSLINFSAEHDGMGKFAVTPDKGDSLIAVWTDEHGVERRTPLPAVKPMGVVLRTVTGHQKILFSVARSGEGGPEYKHLVIMGHMHQHMVYKAKINLEENFMSGGTIPTAQLPTGVLQVTVFTETNLPVAERVVFVNNNEYIFSPELAVMAKNTNKRGNNVLQVEVPDTLRSNLSIAVTDATADGDFPLDDNIISHLLLLGDIRGYVHNPYYYFSGEADSLTNHLDLVMMTHGWRRFKWDQVVKGKLPVIKNPEQDYLSMKVEVLGIDPYKIAKEESLNVILSKKDSSTQMLQLPHLSGIKFGITGLVFFDTAKAYYQFNVNRKLSNEAAVTFNTGLVRGGRMARPLTTTYDGWTAEDSLYLRRNRFVYEEAARIKPIIDQKIKTLESVTVKGRVKTDAQKLDEKYASGMFAGGDAYTFDLVNDPYAVSMMDIFQYLQGKVAGLQITTAGSPGGTPSLTWRGSTPSLYLNEMQVDAQQLQSTPVSDVAMVKVFRPGSGVGFGGGAGGVIAVYTRKGGDEKRNDANFKGLDRATLVGYSVMKEFYVPNYLETSPESVQEDIRTTLYWKPFLLTDKDNKKISIKFFNNDITKKLRVVLEGVNEEGKLTHVEKIIQ